MRDGSLKESQLRRHATCSFCGNKIGNSGIPLFWTVEIQRFGLKLDAIQRQDGLAAMLGGNSFLAMHMGTNEDLAQPMMEPVMLTVCESCAIGKEYPVAVMAIEIGGNSEHVEYTNPAN